MTIVGDYKEAVRLVCAPAINHLARVCHALSRDAGWYTDVRTGEPLQRNIGEMLALNHSEVSEALEGYRKTLQDDHLPHRKMVEVELADVLIRVFDLAEYLQLDLGGALVEKLEYNQNRADHKLAARAAENGKRF